MTRANSNDKDDFDYGGADCSVDDAVGIVLLVCILIGLTIWTLAIIGAAYMAGLFA